LQLLEKGLTTVFLGEHWGRAMARAQAMAAQLVHENAQAFL